MNEHDVKRLALILSVQAEIEGMKAANIIRLSQGNDLAYDKSAFDDAAEELRILASKHSSQL